MSSLAKFIIELKFTIASSKCTILCYTILSVKQMQTHYNIQLHIYIHVPSHATDKITSARQLRAGRLTTTKWNYGPAVEGEIRSSMTMVYAKIRPIRNPAVVL